MKLRNKKTGEIMDDVQYRNYSLPNGFGFRMNGKEWEYHSLAELNEEWEDYEEPEGFYYIRCNGDIELDQADMNSEHGAGHIEIGNYFETREEAEKAVEKLKAWKRLKDKGYYFKRWNVYKNHFEIVLSVKEYDFITDEVKQDLDLLFGGEE